MLTATPMQVNPVEVWDLLSLLGLPPAWTAQNFVDFFATAEVTHPQPSDIELMAHLFRAAEAHYGELSLDEAMVRSKLDSKLKVKKILGAMREDKTDIKRRQLDDNERQLAVRLMKSHTPINHLISRHSRELLRAYFKQGKLQSRIADRQVKDEFIQLTEAERVVYEAVENYIATTYNNASEDKKSAIGFVMTIYRRRLASSFEALRCTLQGRLDNLKFNALPPASEDDVSDDEAGDDDVMDADEAKTLEQEALKLEEQADLERLLAMVKKLPVDTKAKELVKALERAAADDYKQVMIFTQYTDTMDFLRKHLAKKYSADGLMCFSGRGGEVLAADGTWSMISREEVKRRFRQGQARIMICTDAAAEGLNFQFCGALVNYDMPWNPMRVEQRIGRIDRLGQKYPTIRIVNLHYADTVEAEVYLALRNRIDLFQTYVGKLQPILAKLPSEIAAAALSGAAGRAQATDNLIRTIDANVEATAAQSFDLDDVAPSDLELPVLPQPPYTMQDLTVLLSEPGYLPDGFEAKPLGAGEYALSVPGSDAAVRVTTRPEYFENHPESVALWSPGSMFFPSLRDEGQLLSDLKCLSDLIQG